MAAYRRKRKVYLAARFGRQAEMREVREKLHELGYEVVSSWLDEDPTTEHTLDRTTCTQLVRQICDEILQVSVVVCFIDAKAAAGRGGHQVEFGYAYAKGKVVISVGTVERNIFHEDLRVRQFSTVEDFLAAAQSWTSFVPPPSQSPQSASSSV